MISQVNGLANKFGKDIDNIKADLIFPWSILQPGLLPTYKWIFKNNINLDDKPNIIISCGRKSVYLSLYLKKIYSNNIITIHIQNPKTNFLKFDYIISPNHDGIKGDNVINSIGAIHHFTKEKLKNVVDFSFLPKKNLVSIIIGGKNNHYEFSKKNLFDLIDKIKFLKRKYLDHNFLVIKSRRTDKDFVTILEQNLSNIAHVWNDQTDNPYGFALKNSKFFIVTSDSTSMISECASTGSPIYIYHLPFKRKSKRMEFFHNEFEKLNITQKISNNLNLNDQHYEILDEAKRISGIIKERIIKGLNESR